MKVYFTSSALLPKQDKEKLINTLKELNITLMERERRTDVVSALDFKDAQNIYKNNVKQIKSADLIIAEVSFISSGVGYEISLALEEKKPVIAIYSLKNYENLEGHILSVPVTLKGNTSKYIILKEYDFSTLKKSLELSLSDAKALTDTKFILIIPPEIDKYLEWNVKEKGISKAEITRQAVEEKMALDKEYTEHVKSYSPDESASE